MSDRNADGTFAKGNCGGPGRPPRTTEHIYLRTLGETVALDEWEAICRQAVTDAKAGDAKARQWLSDYLLGRPLPRHDESEWMNRQQVFAAGRFFVDTINDVLTDEQRREFERRLERMEGQE